MDKKKLKLSISGNTKKTISNIEQAKSNPRNSVIINKKKFSKEKNFINHHQHLMKKKKIKFRDLKNLLKVFFQKKILSDFEKRKN